MRSVQGQQPSIGGGVLYTCEWHPAGPTRGVIVLVHGLAEHSGRYGELVGTLTAAGFAVYALDQRGHGRSPGARAQIGRFGWLVADLATRLQTARAAQPDVPLVLLGHSMGGAVALATALEHPQLVDALALSAPAIAADPAVSALRVAFAQLLSRLLPGVGVLRLEAALVSRDPAVVAAYECDPLVYRGAVPARTAVELLGAMTAFPARVPALRVPTLVLHGTADGLVPIQQAQAVWQAFGTTDLTVHRYPGLYHELFNEPERAQVYADLLAWLSAGRFKRQ